MRALGCDFPTAVNLVANWFGMNRNNGTVGRNGKSKKPAPTVALDAQVERLPVRNEKLLQNWCNAKPPVTVVSIDAAGGVQVRWPKGRTSFDCIAFPAFRVDGSPVGWILYRADGKTFPAMGKVQERKTHTLRHSKDGLVVVGGMDALAATTTIWVVEGIPDALALSTVLPEGHVAVTNLAGAGARGKLPTSPFRGKDVFVIGDADKPGQEGALRFARAVRRQARSVSLIELPFPITDTDGKDVRDFRNDGHGFADLESLAVVYEPDDSRPRDAPGKEELTETCESDAIRCSPTTPVSELMAEITDRLLGTNQYFGRAGQPVAIRNQTIKVIENSNQLAGSLNSICEFATVKGSENQCSVFYEPLPPRLGNTWLNHPTEIARLPEISLFTRNPVYTANFQLVEPGYDRETGIFFAGEPIVPSSGTEHLDALLRDFCFRSPADRSNYLGILLTIFLVYHFIGSKPGVLFSGNQPVLGKTILAQLISILRDGRPVETVTFIDRDEEFEKRLGSRVRAGATTIIIDNAKGGKRRAAMIDSPCLERSITDSILSFRLLGASADIRCENSHIFCITANTPDISRDLVTRCVPINLYHEGDPATRSFSIADPEGYAIKHRPEILAELAGMVDRWIRVGRPLADVKTRFNKRGWGRTIGGVLQANGEPDFLTNQEQAASELDVTQREFTELVQVAMIHGTPIISAAAEWVRLAERHNSLAAELGEGSPRSKATKMGLLLGMNIGRTFRIAVADSEDVVVKLTKRRTRNGFDYPLQDAGSDAT